MSIQPCSNPSPSAKRRGRLPVAWLLAWLMLLAAPAFAQMQNVINDVVYRPLVNGTIQATALQADGKLLVGGSFTEAGSGDYTVSRAGLARFNTNGSMDTGFAGATTINGPIYSIVPLPDGKILIGGKFSTVGSPTPQAREGVARLNADGSLDTGFVPPSITANPGGDRVFRLLRLSTGKILVAGRFTGIGGTGAGKIARLQPNGALDGSFQIVGFGDTNNDYVWTMAEQADGRILIGGIFTTLDGQPHRNMARLLPNGARDAGFTRGVTHSSSAASVSRVLVQSDGRILVSGAFNTTTNGSMSLSGAHNLARFNTDLSPDTVFGNTRGTDAAIHWMDLQADDKLLVGGDFNQVYNGPTSLVGRSKLARLNADGAPDGAYIPSAITGSVGTLIQQADGRVIAGGNFTTIGGQAKNYLARLVETLEMKNVSAISGGGTLTCALHDSAVKCWGSNQFGQLGVGSSDNILFSALAVPVIGLSGDVAAISAGSFHACAIHNGAAKCWGLNSLGQLGDGSTTNRFEPVPVQGLTGGVTAISVGDRHTCALHNGVAKCWGWNYSGQLGNGSTNDSSVPVPVSMPNGVVFVAIDADGQHTCALSSTGGVWCWGFNSYGQLGNNSIQESAIPVQVSNLGSGVQAVSTGFYHTCALTTAGKAWCWGRGQYGRLGNGSTADSRIPVAVSNINSGATAISAGGQHTCAIHNGAAKCWGYDGDGQLGNDAALVNSSVPVPVSTEVGAIMQDITAGASHSCALQTRGSSVVARCWGDNRYVQLGDGTSINPNLRPTPRPVLVPQPAAPALSDLLFRNGFEP